jgi:uncharacterized protein (DUF885 family)
MLRFLLAVVVVALATPLSQAAGRELPPDPALHAFFEQEFQYELQEYPESATFVGVDDYNDRLNDRSAAAVARRKAHVRDAIGVLQRFDAKRLNAQDRLSRELMLEDLHMLDAFSALYGDLPFFGQDGWLAVGPSYGPQFGFAALAKAAPMRDARDYERYLARLAAIPAALTQMTDAMRAGMRSGWLPPREVMARVPAQFDAYLVEDLSAHPLFAPLTHFPPALPEDERQRLSAAGRALIAERVRPAFAAMKQFLERDYIPAGTSSLAASDLPGGQAYYALVVRAQTTTTLAPAQVHELGLREVARIQGEMDRLVARIGFKGTRSEYMRAIRNDPHNYYTRAEDMLRGYRDIAKRVDAELPRLFAQLPRLPYGIRAMEPFEGDNAEHYTAGAMDGSRAGFFEANVLSLSTRPIYDMESTFLHEAVPGHHLQIARAQEINGLPRFRRNASYNAYAEGWALYAESLGPELGLYTDPASRFGALAWEMVRACRLVLDTGIHAFGWSRDRAIRYLMDNAGLAQAFAQAEVDRYVTDPGQALGYKLGELKIKELRARAQEELGDAFDIRTFHNAVLDDGALPLTVLESRMRDWIAAQKTARAKARQAHGAASLAR